MTTKAKLRENERKKQRLANANAIIEAMSRHGRRFFYSKRGDGRVAHFLFDQNNTLRFFDDYIQNPFVVKQGRDWGRNFSHGGTMKRLVEALALYIREGKTIHPGHIDGDLWGYSPEATAALRTEIEGNPAITVFEERKAA